MSCFTRQTKLDMVISIASRKLDWLNSFSQGRNKRPDHEIEAARREVAVLREIADDYRESK